MLEEGPGYFNYPESERMLFQPLIKAKEILAVNVDDISIRIDNMEYLISSSVSPVS
jgi:hypothetical protein